ncbi:nitronate monooxygenase [Streptomyces nigrescens]|uniref:nitronate monooxygenase n=1 Tax=Streptomyces nigrescens TaxID=1920 RepID=UPI0036F6A724
MADSETETLGEGNVTPLTTPLCRQLGIEVPVVQAPIGSAVTTDLVAAVAEAGGLGTLALTWVTADEAVRRIREVRRLTPKPFAQCFDGGWPDAPHRALRNSTLSAWEAAGRPAAPNRPGEGAVLAGSADGRTWSRYEDMVPVPGMSGDLEALALYAGQSAGLVHDVAPAGCIVADIAARAAALRGV